MPTTKPEATFTAEPGRHDMQTVSVQDAPREAVWRAFTDPELLVRHWGPEELTTEVDEFDPRPGGRWRFVHRDAEGNEYAFRGVIHSLEPNERIIQTFEWEGLPGHVCLQTLTLEDAENGGTRVTQHAVFQTVEDRDGMADTGARDFAPEGVARLAEVLRSL
jgi:uncharacterized protein YndB with AHSA1/START domain